jgi:hypothetical protein
LKARTRLRPLVALALVAATSCTASHPQPGATQSGAPSASTSAISSAAETPTCAAPTPAILHAAGPPAGLGIWLTLDRTTVAQGASITATLHAQNCVSSTIDLTHPTTCPTGGAGLYKADAYAGGQAPSFCGQTLTPDSIAAGATRTWTLTIDTFGEPNSSGQRQPVDAGTYQAEAGISVRAGVWFAAPVTVTVVEG